MAPSLRWGGCSAPSSKACRSQPTRPSCGRRGRRGGLWREGPLRRGRAVLAAAGAARATRSMPPRSATRRSRRASGGGSWPAGPTRRGGRPVAGGVQVALSSLAAALGAGLGVRSRGGREQGVAPRVAGWPRAVRCHHAAPQYMPERAENVPRCRRARKRKNRFVAESRGGPWLFRLSFQGFESPLPRSRGPVESYGSAGLLLQLGAVARVLGHPRAGTATAGDYARSR
jgi:hypothetical protein